MTNNEIIEETRRALGMTQAKLGVFTDTLEHHGAQMSTMYRQIETVTNWLDTAGHMPTTRLAGDVEHLTLSMHELADTVYSVVWRLHDIVFALKEEFKDSAVEVLLKLDRPEGLVKAAENLHTVSNNTLGRCNKLLENVTDGDLQSAEFRASVGVHAVITDIDSDETGVLIDQAGDCLDLLESLNVHVLDNTLRTVRADIAGALKAVMKMLTETSSVVEDLMSVN